MDLINFRSADRADADFLVPLIGESSAGVWPAVWKALASENESVEASGARYLTNPTNDLSIKNTILVESEGTCIGAMISYQEDRIPSSDSNSGERLPLPAELVNALKPYRELSDPNSLFIAEICFLPQARGKGLGTRLLEYARDSAVDRGLPCVTLRVFSANAGAVRLYERFGFGIVDRRPVVPHPDITVAGCVYLMSLPV